MVWMSLQASNGLEIGLWWRVVMALEQVHARTGSACQLPPIPL
jgi:hypothetical protein